MSLPALELDDLTWREMIDAIRTRIAANSSGSWTMHAPVDPGVTLLELFAYLFEQRLYWLDQVPASLSRALMALLDDAPRATRAARAVFALATPDDHSPSTLAAGTVVRSRNTELGLSMTTLEDVALLPLRRGRISEAVPGATAVSLFVDGVDRTTDLRQQRPIAVLPSDGSAGECQIILWVERLLDGSERGRTFTLLVEIESSPGVEPEWAPVADENRWYMRVPSDGYGVAEAAIERDAPTGAPRPNLTTSEPDGEFADLLRAWAPRRIDVPPPATLVWSYSSGAGVRRDFVADHIVDGTGGLRRSGVLRIRLPDDFQPLAASAGLPPFAYALWVRCEVGSFSSPPRITRVLANVTAAVHAEGTCLAASEAELQLRNWLKLPGQVLRLERDAPPPIEDSVQLWLREADEAWYPWRPTDDLYRHGPDDRVFVVDRMRGRLVFGDGLTGRIPVLARTAGERIRLCYLGGGGPEGNLSTQTWQVDGDGATAVNVVPAVGGADMETIGAATARVARALQRLERAVTAADFEALAKSTPGVAIARAHAAVGHHPGFPCRVLAGAITVFVVPQVPRSQPGSTRLDVAAPEVDPGALVAVRRRLSLRRLVGHEVFVRTAAYRAVHVRVSIRGVSIDEHRIKDAIRDVLTRYLDPLVGGPMGAGWGFGTPLRPSELSDRIRAQLEPGTSLVECAIALDAPREFEACRELAIAAHELIYLASVQTSIDRVPVLLGGLR